MFALREKSKYVYRRSPHRITPINGERVGGAETFEKYEIGTRRRKREKKRNGKEKRRNKTEESRGLLTIKSIRRNVVMEQMLFQSSCYRALSGCA